MNKEPKHNLKVGEVYISKDSGKTLEITKVTLTGVKARYTHDLSAEFRLNVDAVYGPFAWYRRMTKLDKALK